MKGTTSVHFYLHLEGRSFAALAVAMLNAQLVIFATHLHTQKHTSEHRLVALLFWGCLKPTKYCRTQNTD